MCVLSQLSFFNRCGPTLFEFAQVVFLVMSKTVALLFGQCLVGKRGVIETLMAIPPEVVNRMVFRKYSPGRIRIRIKNMGNVSLFLVGTEHIEMGITAFYQPVV